jgi:pimeloyl-ACP methyl ester carboxylesterase
MKESGGRGAAPVPLRGKGRGVSASGLRWEGEPDEVLLTRTADGWRLEVARYRARGARQVATVVLGHGFAGTRLIYDLSPRHSLARYLSQRGFDVFCVNLRGRGMSWPEGGPRRHLQWSFDDFVFHDLPAATEEACRVSGSTSCLWVGQEMSGQAAYAAVVSGTAPRIAGAVTLGAPAVTPPEARVPGVTSPPRLRWRGRVPFRASARYPGPLLAYLRAAQLESSFRMSHTRPLPVARYFWNGVPDEAELLADQFTGWIRKGVMESLDGAIRWSERLGEFRIPALLIAGEADRQRPPEAVEATFRALGSGDKTFIRAGRAMGFTVDYGHDDLLVGEPAPEEVFPRVAEWLQAHAPSGPPRTA